MADGQQRSGERQQALRVGAHRLGDDNHDQKLHGAPGPAEPLKQYDEAEAGELRNGDDEGSGRPGPHDRRPGQVGGQMRVSQRRDDQGGGSG